jgi:hypothetical protein
MRLYRLTRAVLAALLAGAATVAADDEDGARVGASVGYSTQFERAAVALDFLVPVNRTFTVVPNGSFVEAGGIHRWTAGVELQWNAPAWRLHRKLLAWGGGGLSVITEDPKGPLDATTRDLVANAVVGVGYDAPATPFVQMRVTLRDPADVTLSVGVRF